MISWSQCSGRHVVINKWCEVGRSASRLCLKGDDGDLVIDPLFHWQPMKRSTQVRGAWWPRSMTHGLSQCILSDLQTINVSCGCSIKQTVAVVKPWRHHPLCDHPGGGQVNKRPNVSKCSRVVATTADDFGDVAIEHQIFVECDTQQLDGRTECNVRTSDVESSWRVDLLPLRAGCRENVIEFVDSWPHLGHIHSNNVKFDNGDIRRCYLSLVSKWMKYFVFIQIWMYQLNSSCSIHFVVVLWCWVMGLVSLRVWVY